ncbi:hypothetical protein [Streptomyces sp. 4N124]|uniref:hypothetical protein n=1 Tax=Streptomyces sp. 4N124 TaxID=3457420 RepID=UPI003FCEEFB0
MTTSHGREGRPLVTTAMAAYSLGMQPGHFRTWAHRHKVTPADYRPNPSRGQRVALWDLTDITNALDIKHNAA